MECPFRQPRQDWNEVQQATVVFAMALLKAYIRWPPSKANRATRFGVSEVLDKLLWKYSEAYGRKRDKYKRNPLWSKDAIASCEKHGLNTQKAKIHEDALRYEHVVPKKTLIEELLSRKHAERTRIEGVFRLSIGAVVTHGEHTQLDTKAPFKDFQDKPLLRYKQAKITLQFNPDFPDDLKRNLEGVLKQKLRAARRK